jgi:K+-transporting ATPase KdpF subunit
VMVLDVIAVILAIGAIGYLMVAMLKAERF